MAETTGIAWTDATANFWEGCTKVGPGCDHCYAENRDKRFHGGGHWGVGAPRRRMSPGTFDRPLIWNSARAEFERNPDAWEAPTPPKWVFSLSLGDFFDKAVDPAWRADAWSIIRRCTNLRWQLVTKRVGNVRRMLPEDWDGGRNYHHVGIIATTVTQEELLRDGPKLLDLKYHHGVKWVGLSCEPQLEMLNFLDLGFNAEDLDWIITGGESRQGTAHQPRPYNVGWARSLLWQGSNLGIPVFVKQLGDNPIEQSFDPGPVRTVTRASGSPLSNAGGKMEEWPADLQVREMPRVYDVVTP